METKEYMKNSKTSHDSSMLGDSTMQWHQEAVLGSGEQRPSGSPYVPKCDIQHFTMEKKKSQLIQKHFHKILTNVQQYLKL